MKSIVILFDENNKNETKNDFSGKSGKQLCFEKYENAAKKLNEEQKIESEIVYISDCSTIVQLFEKINDAAAKSNADFIIFSYADLPFICPSLVCDLVKNHVEYKAEYTFADGYPYGFSPEVIDCGAARILGELAKKNQPDQKLVRDGIWTLLKTDINSFDVESIIADDDWRMLRLSFDCANPDHFIACKNLFNATQSENPEELSKTASTNPAILKTVPGFYNVQIEDFVSYNSIYSPYVNEYEKKNKINPLSSEKRMSYSDFSKLTKKISEFSDSAVISFSLFGEAFHHPQILDFIKNVLSYSGLSVFIETDGLFVTEDFCNQLKEIVDSAEERTNIWPKIMIAVDVDSFTSETYNKIHQISESSENLFEKAVDAVKKLAAVIPGNVYPQFTRMNENEDELESFFRYWNEKSNASGGQLIIQKYDDFCGILPECKPADLSPVERNVCWHLRRDMNILSNGDVILCREMLFENILGNVFTEDLQKIWEKQTEELKNHMECKYNGKCKLCDEYYTYNF